MFEWLSEVIKEILRTFRPCIVLMPNERGLLIRLGIFKRELEPGFHWVVPFLVDTVLYENVTARVEHIPGLATVTKDGKQISCDAIVTYRISDLKKALLTVEHLRDAVLDTCAGVIGTSLCGQSWDDLWGGVAAETVTAACRKRGFRYGIQIEQVQLTGLALTKTLRLTGSLAASAHGAFPLSGAM